MATIYQLVHTLSYGDAISGEALALRRCLRDLGHSSEIFAINTHPNYIGETRDYRELATIECDEVWLHYSIGSPLNALYRNMHGCQRTLIYHNLTPSKWFGGVNPRIARDIESGLSELGALCKLSNRLLADSSFNASELSGFGASAQILPLPLDPLRWQVQANPGIAQLVKREGGVQILHVGRLAPNKCIEDIVRTFYFVHHHLRPNSRLWLVGIDIDTEVYSFSVKRLAQELKLEQAINFCGCLADSEVRALYENCSVYMCMSEHEGFCLPLLEAMHFGLPLIAYESSAIPETVADGGILVSRKSPAELAELVVELSENRRLRQKVTQAGFARVKELSYQRFCEAVAELLRPVEERRANL